MHFGGIWDCFRININYHLRVPSSKCPLFRRPQPRFLLLAVQTYTGHNESYTQGGGGQNEIVWIIGGGGGGEGKQLLTPPPPPPPNPWEILILDLLLDALWWNLGLFSHKHNLPFMCH